METQTMPFVASYSGGKDSALAIYRAIQAGMQPVALLTTYRRELERSWFHGIPPALLQQVAQAMGLPLRLIVTDGPDYREQFLRELLTWRSRGVQTCVFGDIDIPAHLQWGQELCREAGMNACFPLWQQSREALTRSFIRSGFTAHITVIDTDRLSPGHLGQRLTEPLLASIAGEGADVCGENGEYHSFVSDGPIFSSPVAFRLGAPLQRGHYRVAPLELP